MFSRATSRGKSKREVAVDIGGLAEDAAGNAVFSARGELSAREDFSVRGEAEIFPETGTPPEKRRAMNELTGFPKKALASSDASPYVSVLLVLMIVAGLFYVAEFAGDRSSGALRIREAHGVKNVWNARKLVVDDDDKFDGDDDLAAIDSDEETPEEMAALANVVQPHVYVPSADEQDESLISAKPCVLWEDYDKDFCAPRASAYRDLQKMSRSMLRLGVPSERIGVYLDEYAIRLRSSYVTRPNGAIIFSQSRRANCMNAHDSSILGGLMAAIAEDLPPSKSGNIRKNKKGFAQTDSECCHRVCHVMSRLSIGGAAAFESCCTQAPSKCANFYPDLE